MSRFPVALAQISRTALLAVILFGFGLSGRANESTSHTPSRVGVASRSFEDPGRLNWPGTGPRPIRVTVWYPSDGGGTPEFFNDDARPEPLLRNGDVASSGGPRPLIMVSHGSGGNAAQMFWLGHFLAEHGYIAAAVDHNGTDDEELHKTRPTLTDFFGWERARDLSIALTRMLADPLFSNKIDATRIGAAGFSLGATTALWTAGARLDLEALRSNSPPPPASIANAIEQLVEFSKTNPVARESVARANLSCRDDRIRSVFALAPPMGVGFTEEGLREVHVPVCIVVGDADPIAPAATNAQHFASQIPAARLIIVPGERGHYTWPIPAAQRHDELREVAEMARRFFDEQRG